MKLETLQECRTAIDRLDDKLLEILNARMKVVHRVGEIKNSAHEAIYRPEREKEIIDRLVALNATQESLLNRAAIEAIYLEIFAVARNLERAEKVSFLGPLGSFTHQAAESRFGAMSEYVAKSSIRAVFQSLETKRAKYGVVPVENSTDGVVGETLDLLAKHDVKIVAEMNLSIHLAFASLAENTREITKVYSKDKGFGQCREFLVEHGLNEVEHIPVESTAKAAMLAAADPHAAAICSHIAAKLYGVPTLYENIEDSSQNHTRFLILSDFTNAPSPEAKTSILVKLYDGDKPGALVHFLQDLYEAKINLLKIESRPSKDDSGYKYWFFIDFEGHFEDAHIAPVMRRHRDEIKWLGSYVKGFDAI
ncbi:MAG: chloride transporter [Sulfuricurvum sp. PC08-66]|nr:MAG: chloride transporter [Sulfuricurvum sp. PC08-66]